MRKQCPILFALLRESLRFIFKVKIAFLVILNSVAFSTYCESEPKSIAIDF